jgi:tetratricopeptide (TPR) repeat protein
MPIAGTTMARRAQALAAACFILASASTGAALPHGSPGAGQALELCQQAEQAEGADRLALLARGVRRAEEAVAADAGDALAHFALFCNLGRRVKASGLCLAAPWDLVRALRALDAALELAPDDPDVLTAKGALLIELPRVLGGDVETGVQWLRRALARDPRNAVARRYLDERLVPAGVDRANTGY